MFSKPVRKIPRNNRSITGKSPSIKTNSSHHFESALERDHLQLLEFDSEVSSYVTQPVKIPYLHEGSARTYTPDVAIYYHEHLNRRPLIIEIKYQAELIEKKAYLEPKFNAARDYASDNGYEFRIVTENEIRTDYLTNIKLLKRYKSSPIDVALANLIIEWFNTGDNVMVSNILNDDKIARNKKAIYTLWQLIAKQTVCCDLNQKIDMNSLLWMKK